MSLWKRMNDLSKRSRRLLAGALALVVTAGVLWGVGVGRRGPADVPRGQPRPVESDDMSAMPGMDSGMDMRGDGRVRLTADQIRAFGVTFGTVEQRVLADQVRAVGVVAFDETRVAGVTAKFGGYVERLYVDFTGRPVRAGEPLAEIYSPELVAAQEELLLAARLEADLGNRTLPGTPAGSANLVAAARQRLRLWDVSDAQIEEVLASGRARRTLTLYAPVTGVVVEKKVLSGDAIQPGQPLYTIADLSRVWVEAELREADAGLVREGAAATLELQAFPGRPIAGRVEYVYPTVAQQARTLRARIAVANPDGRLKPGMYATVRLVTPTRAALTVPATAVLNTGERRVVFVDLGGGRILPQEVEIGRAAGEYVEVLFGLEPGQRVVTSAQYLLDSESNLSEVMRSMIGQMNTSDMGGMDMGGMDMGGTGTGGGAPPPERE